MRTAVGQTSAECLPQDPGGVGGMGIFRTVRCAVHRCRLLPLRVCPHRSSPQVLQRNVAEPHRNDAHPIPYTRPAGCIHAVHQLSGMTLFTWLFSEAEFSDVAMLVLSAALFTFGYMGLLAFLFKFNGSKLDAYILEDIERSYRRIEETNEKGGKQ